MTCPSKLAMKQRQNTPLVLILALMVLAGTIFANDLRLKHSPVEGETHEQC